MNGPLIILCTERRQADEYTRLLFNSIGDRSQYVVVTEINQIRGYDFRAPNGRVISLGPSQLEKYVLDMGGIVYNINDAPIRTHKMWYFKSTIMPHSKLKIPMPRGAKVPRKEK